MAEFLKDKAKDFNIVYACKIISDNHNNTIHSSTNFKPSDLINCTDENIIKIVKNNMEKSFKGKTTKDCIFVENEKALLCNVFTKKNNNLKKKFKGKKLYNIPIIILKLYNSTSYKIKICKTVEFKYK